MPKKFKQLNLKWLVPYLRKRVQEVPLKVKTLGTLAESKKNLGITRSGRKDYAGYLRYIQKNVGHKDARMLHRLSSKNLQRRSLNRAMRLLHSEKSTVSAPKILRTARKLHPELKGVRVVPFRRVVSHPSFQWADWRNMQSGAAFHNIHGAPRARGKMFPVKKGLVILPHKATTNTLVHELGHLSGRAPLKGHIAEEIRADQVAKKIFTQAGGNLKNYNRTGRPALYSYLAQIPQAYARSRRSDDVVLRKTERKKIRAAWRRKAGR